MDQTRIVVDAAPFNVGDEYQWLAQSDADGAVVTFTGKVRNHNLGDSVSALTLEHYPGMTEKALADIVAGPVHVGRYSGCRSITAWARCIPAMKLCLSA